jgi:hypothetical protein
VGAANATPTDPSPPAASERLPLNTRYKLAVTRLEEQVAQRVDVSKPAVQIAV